MSLRSAPAIAARAACDSLSAMLDAAPISHQRSHGQARVSLTASGGLGDLFQKGSGKAILPRVDGPVPEVVFLNTSGGLTGGDTLTFDLSIGKGAAAMAATQTAERAYASPAGHAKVEVRLKLGNGATLFWLPQETILFQHAALRRATTVEMGDGARFLGVETLVLGRGAMNEHLNHVDLRDARRVFGPDGTIRHAEQICLDSATLADVVSPAGWQGKTVLATLTFVAPDAEDSLGRVRDLIQTLPCAAASAWNDRLVLRILANDSWQVRKALIPVIQALGPGNIPRVWQT